MNLNHLGHDQQDINQKHLGYDQQDINLKHLGHDQQEINLNHLGRARSARRKPKALRAWSTRDKHITLRDMCKFHNRQWRNRKTYSLYSKSKRVQYITFVLHTIYIDSSKGYQIKNPHKKSTLKKKMSPTFRPGLEPATFRLQIRRCHWGHCSRKLSIQNKSQGFVILFIYADLILLWSYLFIVDAFIEEVCNPVARSNHRISRNISLVCGLYRLLFYVSGDSSVVRVPDSCLKCRRFESLQERRDNFLQLSGLTLISVSVPPPSYRSSK